MYNNYSILAIIPARGGSKGVPRKNIKYLAGKPLIAWTIEEAKKSRYIDKLILSSEDHEIIKVAEAWNCEVPFVRPKELAQDDTPSIEIVLHALKMLPFYDYVLLLQPTSPFRNVDDIDGCIEKCIKFSNNACATVCESEKSPYWMFKIDHQGILVPIIDTAKELITRRQDLPKVYSLNGVIYLAKTDWITKTKSFITEETTAYVMPSERSLDIDTELDFEICDLLLKGN